MTRIRLTITLGLVAVLLSGCGLSKYVEERESKQTAMVYGFIDMSDAPTDLEWAQMRQLRPRDDEPFKKMRTDDSGLFYLENLPVGGAFRMDSYGGSTWSWWYMSNVHWTYGIDKREFKSYEFKINKPGLHFLGAYKIHRIKAKSFFQEDKYRLAALDPAGEKELLRKLVKNTKDTMWKTVIEDRMKELK